MSGAMQVAVAAGQRTTQDFTLGADPLNPAEITQASPRSTTEMLRYVPGFTRVESSGGRAWCGAGK